MEDPAPEETGSPMKKLPLPALPPALEAAVRWGGAGDVVQGTRSLPSEPWAGGVRGGQLAEDDWLVSALCSIAAVAPAVLEKVRAVAVAQRSWLGL